MRNALPFTIFDAPLVGVSLIEASAGTGKTWNICGLYLRLLLERKLDVHQILVVTFTNAATAELRTRIRARLVDMLAHLSATPPTPADPFLSELIQLLSTRRNHTRDELRQCTERALLNFDEAAIFTIHSFCQQALADTAFAAGQPFSVELQPDDSDLRLEAIHDFWRKHIASADMAPELAAYLIEKKASPASFDALLKQRLAKPLSQYRWPENVASKIDTQALLTAYQAAKTQWHEQRDTIIQTLLDSDGLHGSSYNDKSIRITAKDYDALFSPEASAAPIKSKPKRLHFCSRFIQEKKTKKGVVHHHTFFDLADNLQSEYEKFETALEHARLQLLRQLLEETPAIIRQRKRERRLAAFDDLLFNLHDALSSDKYPWLAELLRQRFPAALVDEFQDTDPLQYNIFETIYNGQDNTLYMVGDPKQAIYRFRNADLHSYLRAKMSAKNAFSIGDNQRSTDGLIHAVNHLFQANPHAFVLPNLTFTPAGIGQKRPAAFIDQTATDKLSPLCLWQLPTETGERLDRNDAMQRATQATAAEIAKLLHAARKNALTIDGQALRANQIAVLVRSHRQGRNVKQALAALNIGSIEHAQTSVFASSDAEEIERLLAAIWMPSRLNWLRAALATEIMGKNALDIATFSENSHDAQQIIDRFTEYRSRWLAHGISAMMRQFFRSEHVSARMLARPDGERRMTNLLHLTELLHQASEWHPQPDSLLRWLQAQRSDARADEATQLRLESDQNLVQILTVHKSKGLEFPIVFCPFLWDGKRKNAGSDGIVEYHDDEEGAIVDFRPDMQKNEALQEKVSDENDAEDLRLIYVALTRAIYRCYVIAGCYRNTEKSTNQSHTSLLNWLVAGHDMSALEWRKGNRKNRVASDIESAWRQLAQSSKGSIALLPLPDDKPLPLADERQDDARLVLQPTPARMPYGWRIGSFSGLTRGATHENAASDHDALAADVVPPASLTVSEIPETDILHFPKGSQAGLCLHKVFELCDFSDRASWSDAIGKALNAYPQDNPMPTERLRSMLEQMLDNTTGTSLHDNIVLQQLAHDKRLNELGFYLPTSRFHTEGLMRLMKDHDYPAPALMPGELEGYLKGFIDLVFEHDGRYYLLDWKSNYLGNTPADYDTPKLREAMQENGYYLQYLLYTVALNRYLRLRLPHYLYEEHFGGVLYLFVRGVRPDWKKADGTTSGVFFDRPSTAILHALDALFSSPDGKAA